MGRHYDAELLKVGLRTTQFWLLTEVLEHGPARPCDLAKAMAPEPSTLTRKLKPLVAAGWLELAFGADRRTRSVCITSSGRIKRAEDLRRRGERTQALAGCTQRVHPRCGQKGVWRRHASRDECASRYGLRSRNVSAMHALPASLRCDEPARARSHNTGGGPAATAGEGDLTSRSLGGPLLRLHSGRCMPHRRAREFPGSWRRQ